MKQQSRDAQHEPQSRRPRNVGSVLTPLRGSHTTPTDEPLAVALGAVAASAFAVDRGAVGLPPRLDDSCFCEGADVLGRAPRPPKSCVGGVCASAINSAVFSGLAKD